MNPTNIILLMKLWFFVHSEIILFCFFQNLTFCLPICSISKNIQIGSYVNLFSPLLDLCWKYFDLFHFIILTLIYTYFISFSYFFTKAEFLLWLIIFFLVLLWFARFSIWVSITVFLKLNIFEIRNISTRLKLLSCFQRLVIYVDYYIKTDINCKHVVKKNVHCLTSWNGSILISQCR